MKKQHWTLLSALFLFAGCGSSTTTAPTLTFNLYDAPPDLVTSVRLYVTSIDAHVASPSATDSTESSDSSIDDDGKWVSLPVGAVIDLVQFQGSQNAKELGTVQLPEGKITQLRLVLDKTKTHLATWGGLECELDLTQISGTGIKINHVFKTLEAANGDTLSVSVDYDLSQAMDQRGDCFRLKPVLTLGAAKKNGVAQTVQ